MIKKTLTFICIFLCGCYESVTPIYPEENPCEIYGEQYREITDEDYFVEENNNHIIFINSQTIIERITVTFQQEECYQEPGSVYTAYYPGSYDLIGTGYFIDGTWIVSETRPTGIHERIYLLYAEMSIHCWQQIEQITINGCIHK